jgi:hypothetical protein
MIFNALDEPIKGVQVLSTRQKQWSFPFDLACLECLNVIIATNEQLKDLAHFFLNPML